MTSPRETGGAQRQLCPFFSFAWWTRYPRCDFNSQRYVSLIRQGCVQLIRLAKAMIAAVIPPKSSTSIEGDSQQFEGEKNGPEGHEAMTILKAIPGGLGDGWRSQISRRFPWLSRKAQL